MTAVRATMATDKNDFQDGRKPAGRARGQKSDGGPLAVTVMRLARRVAAAGLGGAVLCGGVAADTLAQPPSAALEMRAANYVRYREDVSAIEAAAIKGPEATREAHKRLAAHDPAGLAGGWVAYAALVAADTPEFVEALQAEVASKRRRNGLRGRDAFFAAISEDPSYPRKLKGADEAIQRVLGMTAQDAGRFFSLGEAFKSEAYAMQKTNWGKQRIASSSKRLSEADAYASSRPAAVAPPFKTSTKEGVTSPTLASVDQSWAADWGASEASGRMTEPNAQVIMDRVLNLAARYALDGLNEKVVDVYAKNNKSEQCLSMAKLTLTQCIAATRAPYEEAFCLGEHGLNDIGVCVGWVAGAGSS